MKMKMKMKMKVPILQSTVVTPLCRSTCIWGSTRCRTWSGCSWQSDSEDDVAALHHLEQVHRDWKSSNGLVNEMVEVRLCDLDEARDGIMTTIHSTTVKSPMYTCPCVGETAGYGSSADVYSLSLTTGQLLVGLPVLRLYAEAGGRYAGVCGSGDRGVRR